jgi:hypothetical protein
VGLLSPSSKDLYSSPNSHFRGGLKTYAGQSNRRGLKTCYTQRTWVEAVIKLKDAGLADDLLYDAKYPHDDIRLQVSHVAMYFVETGG